MDQRVARKLRIPHPNEPGCELVGTLEQLAPSQPTSGRKIALILHGTLGHKDYLFQKALATRLPLDSFRFDFRGNHESGGAWRQSSLHEDVEDLQAVVDHLWTNFGYVTDLVIGHSRGAIIAFRWIATSVYGQQVSAFVNVSGRYRMEKIVDSDGGKLWLEGFEKEGQYEWDVTVAKKLIRAKVTPQDLKAFIEWDTSFVWDKFPKHTNVLSIHGVEDRTVPVYDAFIYTKALSTRKPGTTTLHLIEKANHNFTAHKEEVVNTIVRWWDHYNKGNLEPVNISLIDMKALL